MVAETETRQGLDVASSVPLLQARDVTFGYNRQELLHEVSLAIQTGEMVGLLGPNGSGKTTLLRLLSGIFQPWKGQILLEGRELRQWGRRDVAQRIAVVPQELHMPFAFTVKHMVEMGRTPFIRSFFGSQGSRDREAVQEAMAIAGVADLAERIFNELSGGERQRVLVAMALAQEPSVLLLDEPTAHLDIKYQIETLELVRRLNREHKVTVLAALHDLNLAARYFPRLILFQRGIVADSNPAEVLDPALLRRVYGVDVQVGIMRGSAHLSVLPPVLEEKRGLPERPVVHVIAGGGSGEVMMRALADAHIPFVAGALNIGDSDHTLALHLATEVITEQPYAPISSAVLDQVRASLRSVALLILCPVPIGAGNLALLREALFAAQRGLSVIMLEEQVSEGQEESLEAILPRDYTEGKGTRLLMLLRQAGATVVTSVSEALECAKKQLADETFLSLQ
ncbi:iron complex transport system ATP-binding protein [Thermosporothrix hazakensis]|jgi:iron complex transport system ATP-binding protein|uniref:Iron complex transport system ATP-binding protein n=2 Tax=Thermosporothrix TaxID=768650 RepID=A0A326U934_THEHA|nr:ABC transporter ATP-binding protein [Thermosporothrix hazakensis]PZW30552.1 iron complex transport system ATP-binding protein [Thermosporothrix hazakensis]BBH91267.1 ABC transporter [Thermosporothrix sp. COM3]GCE49413.1 ABC transporter [Thermosporothrix hazakensis]